ncbi:MAG: sensor histidine kinase [Rhizobium sp.]|nr:sensor histidine kinase [Rhizobium sp.]
MTVSTESELDWVLVLAPFRKDADYIAAFLQEHKIEVKAAKPDADLIENLAMSPGMIVITHEALSPNVLDRVAAHLVEQPDWSEVPIIVLLERAAPLFRIRTQLQDCWPGARILFYSRPITPLELVNGIQSNLLVRLRQREVRDSIEREKELRLELNHRVKNILASVQSIFQMTKRGATTLEELAQDFSGRLQALSNVHAAVFEAGGETVRLSAVVALTVSPYNGDGATRIKVTGEDMVVRRDAGTTIALCLHELITNAIKYGALSQPGGHVELVWAMAAGQTDFRLSWAEVGGPAVREPTRQGYGTRYVRSALSSLFGTVPDIAFAPDGFHCSVQGPAERISAS